MKVLLSPAKSLDFKSQLPTEKNSFLVPNVSEYTFFEEYIPEHNTYFIWAEEKKIIDKIK